MVVKVPGTNNALLTVTSKMPCYSWSLPAIRSCPMAWFGPGGICGESKEDTTCYATKGSYAMYQAVQDAQEARYQWAIRASMHDGTGNEFVEVMTHAIMGEARRQQRKYKKLNGTLDGFQAYFRVHDSGDLFSPSYTYLWLRVCQKLEGVQFWFPTRMWRTKNLHMLAALHALNALPNVVVRPSALRFDDPAPVIEGLSAGTTAADEGFNCPASTREGKDKNKCMDCRTCWDGSTVVSYHAH